MWMSACGSGDEGMAFMADDAAAGEVVEPARAVPASTSTTPVVPPTTSTTPVVPPTTTTVPGPVFASSVVAVTADELGESWRAECPVGLEDLRRVGLAHWDDAGAATTGTLVVHADHADDMVTVFARLFEAGFPIHSMQPIVEFEGDDGRSMRANNTSAFNCREIDGRPGVWSQHAYGGAIDINPLVNPWVRGGRVDPPGGAPFVDRDASVTGLIVAGDVVTRAFADIGWGWGGDWTNTVDYQHFSHNGR
jgi:hypothetical protein